MIGLLVWALGSGSPASATQTCSTSCGTTTLKCCVATGTCTSAAGSINCNGTVYTCDAINAYNACRSDCLAGRTACRNQCTTRTCLLDCDDEYQACLTFQCGPAPQTSFGC
jgi:hypothetical protein